MVALRSFLLPLCGLLPALAQAQISYRERAVVSAGQNAFPSQGPASARFDPSALADAHLVYFAYGNDGRIGLEYRRNFAQLAFALPQDKFPLPIGLAAGVASGFEPSSPIRPSPNGKGRPRGRPSFASQR